MKIELDVHTHTLASGHAFGTIREMAAAAAERGLKLLAFTEHTHSIPGTCSDIYFHNLRVAPQELYGVKLLYGAEINIIDHDGGLDVKQWLIDALDIRIAGIHGICYEKGTPEQNTAAVLGAMANPDIDIISHPDDGALGLDYEALVAASKKTRTLLELNNHSVIATFRQDTRACQLKMMELCKREGVPMVIDSDAHDPSQVGDFSDLMPLLAEAQFPESLILNTSAEGFLQYLAENRKRPKKAN